MFGYFIIAWPVKSRLYLTIIPRVRVGYELAIIISYPTSASGIIVLLKTPTKYREFFLTLFVKTTDFQLVFNFEQTRTVTIFGEHGIMAHIPYTMMAKPIKALELRYPMIQFSIMINILEEKRIQITTLLCKVFEFQ